MVAGAHDGDVWDSRQSWLFVLEEDELHRCAWRVMFIRLFNLLRRGAGRRGMGYCLLVIGRVSRFCVG